MSQCAFSDKAIEVVLSRANANKRQKHKQRNDRTEFRPLGFDFAKAFVELLFRGYSKEQRRDKPRAFEELMESLLNALSCAHPDARHGYKQIAGWLFGPRSRFVRELERRTGAVSPKRLSTGKGTRPDRKKAVRVIVEGGNQLTWVL